jgi:hypothetical protein
MYVYCLYPAKSQKQFQHCLKRAETIDILIAFNGSLYQANTYTVTVSYHLLYMNQVPEQLYLDQ